MCSSNTSNAALKACPSRTLEAQNPARLKSSKCRPMLHNQTTVWSFPKCSQEIEIFSSQCTKFLTTSANNNWYKLHENQCPRSANASKILAKQSLIKKFGNMKIFSGWNIKSQWNAKSHFNIYVRIIQCSRISAPNTKYQESMECQESLQYLCKNNSMLTNLSTQHNFQLHEFT